MSLQDLLAKHRAQTTDEVDHALAAVAEAGAQPGEAFADAFLKAFGGLDGVDPEDWRYPSDEDVEQLRRLGGMK